MHSAINATDMRRASITLAMCSYTQRLQSETEDQRAQARAADIELTLKRLAGLSERLMQLARAEGGRLRLEQISDLRLVAEILTEDFRRLVGRSGVLMDLPTSPVMSDLDPDVFAIIYRNLVENALRHGTGDEAVKVSLMSDGLLRVTNDGAVVPKEVLHRLTDRFERVDFGSEGSGLGLAIVNAIANRVGSKLSLRSPRPGFDSGFEASIMVALKVVKQDLK